MDKELMDPHACNRIIASIILTAVQDKDIEWFDTPKAHELLTLQTLLPDNPEYYKLRIKRKHKPTLKKKDDKPFRPGNRAFWTDAKVAFVIQARVDSRIMYGRLSMQYVAEQVNREFGTNFNNRTLNKLTGLFKEWYNA